MNMAGRAASGRDCRCRSRALARSIFSHTSDKGRKAAARRAPPARAARRRQSAQVVEGGSIGCVCVRAGNASAKTQRRLSVESGRIESEERADLFHHASSGSRSQGCAGRCLRRVRAGELEVRAASLPASAPKDAIAERSGRQAARAASGARADRRQQPLPGAWLTIRKRARGGGSSRTFRSALAALACRSSARSMMQIR